MNTRILLVEDDYFLAAGLAASLKSNGFKNLEIANTKNEALTALKKGEIELAIVDIELDGKMSGIEIGSLAKSKGISFFYLTSYSNASTIEQAAATQPNGYLTKPYRVEDVIAAIKIYSKAGKDQPAEHANTNIDFLFVRVNGVLEKIILKEIKYLKAVNVYVKIFSIKKEYSVRGSLADVQKHLPSQTFRQIHRSYVVNINYVESIDQNLVVINKTLLPISRTYKKQFIQAMNLL